MGKTRTEKVSLAKSWRNPVAAGGFMAACTAYQVGLAIQLRNQNPAFPVAFGLVAMVLGALTLKVILSAHIQVRGDLLYLSRLLQRNLILRRSQIVDVRVRRSQFGIRPTMGRSLDLILRDGRVVSLGEFQVPDSKPNAENVEGLEVKLRTWLATGLPPEELPDHRVDV